ncbi:MULTISPECIES: hypothetical protein [Rhodonellum]|uniref:hypothetical protein n=1 Tax=Rhodonellum TaxID=336827 RepID=UPI0003A83A5C|nr:MULTISPECIES: hypothetical protein [Rhodonellum]
MSKIQKIIFKNTISTQLIYFLAQLKKEYFGVRDFRSLWIFLPCLLGLFDFQADQFLGLAHIPLLGRDVFSPVYAFCRLVKIWNSTINGRGATLKFWVPQKWLGAVKKISIVKFGLSMMVS